MPQLIADWHWRSDEGQQGLPLKPFPSQLWQSQQLRRRHFHAWEHFPVYLAELPRPVCNNFAAVVVAASCHSILRLGCNLSLSRSAQKGNANALKSLTSREFSRVTEAPTSTPTQLCQSNCLAAPCSVANPLAHTHEIWCSAAGEATTQRAPGAGLPSVLLAPGHAAASSPWQATCLKWC